MSGIDLTEGINFFSLSLKEFLEDKTKIGIDPNWNQKDIKNPQIIAYLLEISCLEPQLCKPFNAKFFVELLLSLQKDNGSWLEIHRNYDYPSALITSISVISLKKTLSFFNKRDVTTEYNVKEQILSQLRIKIAISIKKGIDYILLQKGIECIKKSELNFLNILNANAAAGYAVPEISQEMLKGIASNQKKNGSLPYSSPIRAYPFDYSLYLDSIFYHVLTIYYIKKIIKSSQVDQEIWVTNLYNNSIKWIYSKITKKGKVKWKYSRFPHADHQNNTYIFILYILNQKLTIKQKKSLITQMINNSTKKGVSYVYEPAPFWTLIFRFIYSIRYLFDNGLNIKQRFYRVLHSCFQELARTRLKKGLKPSFSDRLTKNSFSKPKPYNLPSQLLTLEILKVLLEIRNEQKIS